MKWTHLDMSANMLHLPVGIAALVGLTEILGGAGALVGGMTFLGRNPQRHVITRLAGLAIAPVMLGAIYRVHWPHWDFMATPEAPMGGMAFQVVLLGLALHFLINGNHRV